MHGRRHDSPPWAEVLSAPGGRRSDLCGRGTGVGMRYIIVGAGAVGGAIGGRLSEAGHDVVLVARGEQYEALRTRGLRLVTPDGPRTHVLPVIDRPEAVDLTRDDVLVLAVKTQDSTAALDAWSVRPVAGGSTAGERLPLICAHRTGWRANASRCAADSLLRLKIVRTRPPPPSDPRSPERLSAGVRARSRPTISTARSCCSAGSTAYPHRSTTHCGASRTPSRASAGSPVRCPWPSSSLSSTPPPEAAVRGPRSASPFFKTVVSGRS